jgi:hypothetical protein
MCFVGSDLYLCTYTFSIFANVFFRVRVHARAWWKKVGYVGSWFWVLLAGRLGVRYHSGFRFFGHGLVERGDFVTFFVWHVQMHIRSSYVGFVHLSV